MPETCGGHLHEGVNMLRSYLLTISAGVTRRHKVVDRHCPCAPDKDQKRQSDRDNVILVSFTFLVSHPIHEEAAANFDRHYRADQRVSPLEALKAITINAAYQYGEEKSKGSIEPGKLADLEILDRNPLKGDPMTIKDIKVVGTIKEGNTIYSRPPTS